MGSSWKVAYADFMTAMMAFFLVMWLLNMAPKETLRGMAGLFKEGAVDKTDVFSPTSSSNNPLIQYVTKMETALPKDEIAESHKAIVEEIRNFLRSDSLPSQSSGISSDNVGVLLHITANLMFKPNTVEFTAEGERVLQEVMAVMIKYRVYLVVRGHADSSETGAPYFPSKWELSAARANAAVRYLIDHGMNPALIRSVAYADTRPQVPSTVVGAAAINGRVEFNFHRPEVMTSVVGY